MFRVYFMYLPYKLKKTMLEPMSWGFRCAWVIDASSVMRRNFCL